MVPLQIKIKILFTMQSKLGQVTVGVRYSVSIKINGLYARYIGEALIMLAIEALCCLRILLIGLIIMLRHVLYLHIQKIMID
jgi:hypothetical protein